MALELQLIKHHSGILIPATPETSDILQSKTRLGDVLVAEFRRVFARPQTTPSGNLQNVAYSNLRNVIMAINCANYD